MSPRLYLGNRNYSSWSLRAWISLRWAGIAFDEEVVPLGEDGVGMGQAPALVRVSPSGQVPVLHLEGARIWDSLAIAEWAAEQAPALWPADPTLRAVCRSVTCEMHSGYAALRRDLPFNVRRRSTAREWPGDTLLDIARVQKLWTETLATFGEGSPFLFGARSLADAFFLPVASRFRTYGVLLDPAAQAYVDTLLADEAFRQWESAAEVEPWTLPLTDAA